MYFENVSIDFAADIEYLVGTLIAKSFSLAFVAHALEVVIEQDGVLAV